MPTLDQIGNALRKAHAAGNEEDAKKLAQAYRNLSAGGGQADPLVTPQEAQLTSFLENSPTPSTPSDQKNAWWKEFHKLPSEQQEAWWKKELAAVDLKDKLELAPW